jgi:predicted secreted hydrolase
LVVSAEVPQPSFSHATADHAPHPGFQTEWWYYTGQLYEVGSEPFRHRPRYGFQLTFFRRQESAAAGVPSEYLAHAALTDLRSGVTQFASRQGGGLIGVAGADPRTLEVWFGEWVAEAIGDVHVLRFSPERGGETQVRLVGRSSPAPWLQGIGGFSKKGACERCASHYYSLARIPFEGEIRTSDGITPVHGLGWMDHEFMSNTLSAEQVGWDWMGLMLKDGRSLTVFRLRDAKGGSSFASASILKDGKSETVAQDGIILTPSEEWTSPQTRGRYPLAWRIQIPAHGIDLTVRARAAACELGDGSSEFEPRYWEGPVASSGEEAIGYLEMTGYVGRVKI